ncbi:tetratricopeptide repeat protein [Streptomyces nigrescens]|uniref:tetratricopeptide repeat protein n=1 Tax=Streptomyces nigrescens TaxID=1920 RepID=UPI00382BC8FD
MRDTVRAWTQEWQREGRHGPAVVLWSGHAGMSDGRLRLLTRDTTDVGDEEQTYSTELLAGAALRCGADQILLLIDTCHSGAGVLPAMHKAVQAWSQRTIPPGRSAWLGVVASCQCEELAHGRGVLLDTVAQVLRYGPSTSAYRHEWSVRNRGVTGATVIEAALAQWPQDSQRPLFASSGTALPVFRNPRWRREADEELVEHLVLAARGGSGTEEGWFFTGRRRVLQSIVSWMRAAEPGLFQVTGSAGCGKSAVLGRIATLSDPRQRAAALAHGALREADPDPGEGSVDAALHLRGLTAQQVAVALADKLGLPVPKTPSALIKELEDPDTTGERPVLIIFDGLDEAAPEQSTALVEQLLAPLSRVASVLLGSRDRPFRPQGAAQPTLDDSLTRFISTTELVNLDEEPDTTEDIEAYVGLRLRSEGITGTPAQEAASRLAERAVGSAGGFLFARLVTTSLIRRFLDHGDEAWNTAIPASIAAAFTEDLDNGPALTGSGRQGPLAARELLTALAWSAGNGMPAGGIWERAATACSHDDWTYEAADLDWVLNAYGRYIVEDSDGFQAVYRICHRELVDHLRRISLLDRDGGVATCRAVVERLRESYGQGVPPRDVPPYLRYALVSHVLMAGEAGIALLRTLVPLDEQTFLPALSVALNDHALIVAESDGHHLALPQAEEAVALRRSLMESAPETHRPFFAGSLLHLAQCRVRTGDRQGALTAAQEATDAYRELSKVSAAAYLSGLAGALHLFARCLTDAGDREGALRAARGAVDAFRELSRTSPGAYLPSLADSLHTLANRLSEAGEFASALSAAEEAVEISRPFARANPSAYLPGFAMFLNTLATSLARTGAYRAALGPALSATKAHRELVKEDSAGSLPGLAVCLYNLSLCLGRAGEPEAALTAAVEATTISQELVPTDAAKYRPTYATALGNLADRAADCGRVDEALSLAQQATRICRELAAADPGAHLQTLASALHDLSCLLASARQEEAARAHAQEATGLYRTLARENPGVYHHEFATSCENLALRLANAGDTEEAVALAREAVAVRRTLVQRSRLLPFLSSLANSLGSLALCEEAHGDTEAARRADVEALGIRRHLAEADPATQLPPLAITLQRQANRLAESAAPQSALAFAREAVAILRGRGEPHSLAYRVSLADALSALARSESACHHTQAALAAAQEATDLYRALARTAPRVHLRAVPGSLLNLAHCQAIAKDVPAAAASAQEAADVFLALAGDSPAHIDDAVDALHELTDYLAETGEIEKAGQYYDKAIEQLAEHPGVVRRLRYARTSLLMYEEDLAPGIHALIHLLLSDNPVVRDDATFDARDALRNPPDDDRDRVIATWRHITGAAPPAWLTVPDATFLLVFHWLACADWSASRDFWEQHEARLETPQAATAMEEVAMLEEFGERAGLLLRLMRQVPDIGRDAAFLPFLLADRLGTWFLDEPHTAVHSAVLHLAREDGIDAAQRYMEERSALAHRARRAGVAADTETLRHCAAVADTVLGDHYSARLHLCLADVFTSGALPTAGLPLAPNTDARDRAIEDIAEIITRQPRHAQSLNQLLKAVLARGTG